MKKLFLSFALLAFIATVSFGQNVSVTFQVNSPDSTPVYVFGNWNGWTNWPGTPMTAIGGGTYSATVSLPQSATYEYLFVTGVNPHKEVLDPAWSCTNGNGQYTNRVLNVGTSNVTACSNWSSCSTCGTASTTVVYTFQVQSPDSTPVYIFGSWNNWFWPGTPMTAVGNGKYQVAVPLSKATSYEYLYVNGSGTPVKEALDPAWPCTNGNGQYTNRTLMTGQNDSTICNNWHSCNSCNASGPTYVNVTFEVDAPDSTPVFVFGSWSNWLNFPGTPMTSIGNNRYQAVLSLQTNQNVEYLYVNGNSHTKESLDPAGACTNGNAQYTNRVASIGASDMALCNIWATCQTCAVGIQQFANGSSRVQVGTNGVTILSNDLRSIDGMDVRDVLGRTVYSAQHRMDTNSLIPVSLQPNTMYFVTLQVNGQSQTFKALVLN